MHWTKFLISVIIIKDFISIILDFIYRIKPIIYIPDDKDEITYFTISKNEWNKFYNIINKNTKFWKEIIFLLFFGLSIIRK
jgi:hypothetical protein